MEAAICVPEDSLIEERDPSKILVAGMWLWGGTKTMADWESYIIDDLCPCMAGGTWGLKVLILYLASQFPNNHRL